MNELIIRLTGEIKNSNFDDWKTELIAQIHSIKKELVTDDDFVTASAQVKSLKTAEKSLVNAKQSAIEQASEIQQLFSAIDEISEEARQARLSLERQIKKRKAEIKSEIIEYGVNLVSEFIENQNDDFKSIDHKTYLDRQRFEQAIRGKASTKGMNKAVNALFEEIKKEILCRINDIQTNCSLMNNIPNEQMLLFQDRQSLLSVPPTELELIIKNRILKFHEESANRKTNEVLQELDNERTIDISENYGLKNENYTNTDLEKFKVIVNLSSSKDTAIDIARTIQQTLENNSSVTKIHLIHDRS